ncbi:MAG: hypothetical protein KDA79_25360, partial [Planctomycetaceae bacterium]|nr:hypothetical protein [Planctomycetaceae bacterium]
ENEESITMAEPSPPNLLILLTDDEKLGRMTVQLEGFMAFTDQLITDLEKLEEDWRGTASPAAMRASFKHRRRWV